MIVIMLPQTHKLMSFCVYNRLDNITVVKILLSFLKQEFQHPTLSTTTTLPTFQDYLL